MHVLGENHRGLPTPSDHGCSYKDILRACVLSGSPVCSEFFMKILYHFCNPPKNVAKQTNKNKIIDLKAEKIEDQGQGSGWRLGSHPVMGYGRVGYGQVPAGLLGDLGALGAGAGASSIPVLSDKHQQCPGPSILPWTFLHQWARLAAGAIAGPQRPGYKGELDLEPGDTHGWGMQWTQFPGGLFVLGLLNFAALLRHSPHPYLLPHAGCSPTLAWFCAGFWSSRKKRDPWLWELSL